MTRCEQVWHLADADGSPLSVGFDADGNVWLDDRVRLTPRRAEVLAEAVRRAALAARVLAVPPALAAALTEARRTGGCSSSVVAAAFARAIRAGAYAPGAALPSAADLNAACRAAINAVTLAKAMAALAGKGLAEQAPGGWRVPPLPVAPQP